ncbi:MAG TPA: SCO family protein [Dongiaceae bacterium]|nr:SCO family protein [Dongiaceae bacterium]
MDTHYTHQPSAAVVRSNRKALLLTLALFTLPVLVAYVLLKTGWYTAAGTSNRGLLVDPPLEFDALTLTGADGSVLSADQFRKKWWIVFVVPATCAEACRNSLYQMRQVHQALGQEFDRVGELVITPFAMDAATEEWLTKEFSESTRARADASHIDQVLAPAFIDGQAASQSGHLYLVDTQGALFMHYPGYADEKESILKGRNLLKDLQHVLKISKIG